MSLRRFSAIADLSPTYVSRLERGIGSTGKTPHPTLSVYKTIASCTGLTLDQLLKICEDDMVVINSTDDHPGYDTDLTEGEQLLLDLFRQIPEADQALVLQMIRVALQSKGLL